MPRLSIKTKLSVVISILVLGPLLFTVGYFPRRVGQQIRGQAEMNARRVAEATGYALAPAITARNKEHISRALEGVKNLPSFSFCIVFDDQGHRLDATPGVPDWANWDFVRTLGKAKVITRHEDGVMVAADSIFYRGSYPERAGVLMIGFTTLDIQEAVDENFRLSLWVFFAALALGTTTAWYFANHFIRPLLRLTAAANRVAKGHLGGISVRVHTGDELEDLSCSFEVMTNTLRVSRGEIENQNRQLETRVQEKTLELTELNESLLQSFQKLQEVDRMKDEFLANMSHELRTPLNAVIGFSGLLLQESTDRIPDDVKEDLQIILQNGRSLLTMIDSILDLSKIEAGKFELEPQEMDPLSVIEDIRALATGLILDRPIRFSYTAPPWRVLVDGDPGRFKQVLTNLVGNAIKFTEFGEVAIMVEKRAGLLRVGIRDTGIGMSADEISRLFKPFQQVDGSITRRFGGTGLGLALSHRLMELMKGRITVESEKGRGSTFTVELQILREDPA